MAGAETDLPKPLAELASRLAELEEATERSGRELRRLQRRVRMANGHRRNVVALTAALLRHHNREALLELGADPLDIAEAQVDSPYDGLLPGLVRAAGGGIRRVFLIGAAVRSGYPAFAEEVLEVPLEALADTQELTARAPDADAAVVARAEDLLEDAALRAAVAERAAVLIVLLGAFNAQKADALRDRARRLAELIEAAGLPMVHVSGAADLAVFARPGLIEAGRPERFPGSSEDR